MVALLIINKSKLLAVVYVSIVTGAFFFFFSANYCVIDMTNVKVTLTMKLVNTTEMTNLMYGNFLYPN